MPKDLTQQYAHYHTKWQQEDRIANNIARMINTTPYNHPIWQHRLRLAKRRATYANKRMCDVEAQNIVEGGQIGSLTWVGMTGHFKAVQDRTTTSFPAVQDGYIIPATPPCTKVKEHIAMQDHEVLVGINQALWRCAARIAKPTTSLHTAQQYHEAQRRLSTAWNKITARWWAEDRPDTDPA